MFKNSILKVIGLILLISGMIIAGLSSYEYVNFNSFLNDAKVTNATILDKKLLHSYSDGSICEFDLKLEYEVDNKLYCKNIGVVNPENDDIVEVYYDTTNPNRIHVIKDVDFITGFYTVVAIIGGAFFVAGIICVLLYEKSTKYDKGES